MGAGLDKTTNFDIVTGFFFYTSTLYTAFYFEINKPLSRWIQGWGGAFDRHSSAPCDVARNGLVCHQRGIKVRRLL